MPANVFALLLVLLLVPHYLWAKVLSIPINVPTAVELEENDEIRLVGFPTGWVYSRIVLGINSVPSLQLSGNLVTNDCLHELHGYYDEVAFAYTGEYQIIYHGPTQNLPIHWWVDSSPVLSPCKSYSEMQRKDSVFAKIYSMADSIFSDQTSDYIDLGEINSETIFEGTSANFKIVNLPDWFYNRIYVQIEPLDGRELKGAAFSGKSGVEVVGYSSKFGLEQKTFLPPTFELVFPEYRKVRLKWWAEVGVPTTSLIESKERVISSDSVEVEYIFDDNDNSKGSVKIVYDRHKFVDGKVPIIKKHSFDPHGSKMPKTFGVRGDAYEIEAKVNPGDSVVIAIPVGNGYQPGKDSVIVERYDETEDRWIEEPVDSIVDGYAYVNKPQQIFGIIIPIIVGIGVGLCVAIDDCRDAVVDVLKGMIRVGGMVYKWVYEFVKAFVCLDFDKIFGVNTSSSDNSKWDIGQGKIEQWALVPTETIGEFDARRKERLKKLSEPYPDCNGSEEKCKWERTRDNLDIILADVVLSQLNTKNSQMMRSRYRFYIENMYTDNAIGVFEDADGNLFHFDEYFMVNSGLIDDAVQFVNGVRNCYKAVDFTGSIVQSYIDMNIGAMTLNYTKACNSLFGFSGLDLAEDAVECSVFLASDKSILEGHQEKLIAISEAMVRISLLAWLKKYDSFRKYALVRYKVAYDGIMAWLELAGPLLDYNNIAIKAYGSLALFEYIYYGTNKNLEMVNAALNRHYGDNGGFSEGTGYSQYIWDDLPYVLVALKDAYKSRNDLKSFSVNENFLKSPDYMFEFSRPVGAKDEYGNYKHYGLIPVEVDDGVTYNPDYRVWAKLKDNPKYLKMSDMHPLKAEDNKFSALIAFGFPDNASYGVSRFLPSYRGTLWGNFKDGIGMITAVNGDDTVALSMIAENENLWKRGQAHDQQDNLSITLTSSKKGFLIQDPGYSGFEARSKTDGFHTYIDHNVLTTGYTTTRSWGQDDNRFIGISQLKSRMSDFTGSSAIIVPTILAGSFELFAPFSYTYSVEGGEPAYLLDRKINEPQSGVIGFTATTKINKHSGTDMYDNNRTIMYFGGNFWVIDRPRNIDDMFWTWWANSPIDEWRKIEELGLKLYGSWDGKLTPNGQNTEIIQNGTRSDFLALDKNQIDSPKIKLQNYRYRATDTQAKSYVMTYSLGDEIFTMDRTYCPITSYQCFVNSTKNMRVIVPPSGTKFRLCDVLPNDECSGDAYSTGITMLAKTTLGEWTTHWVLDGDLTAVEKGVEIPITSATFNWSYYVYERANGTPIDSRETVTYLPALPILLLR